MLWRLELECLPPPPPPYQERVEQLGDLKAARGSESVPDVRLNDGTHAAQAVAAACVLLVTYTCCVAPLSTLISEIITAWQCLAGTDRAFR